MKTVWLILAGVLAIGAGVVFLTMRGALATGVQYPERSPDGTSDDSFWNQKTRTLEGDSTSLEPWRGQVALVVNVASKCGLTPQYAELEALYRELKNRGFVVLAFPSNEFLGQEPGTAAEIRAFCDTKYQVSFPLFEKMSVKGEGKSSVYRFLTADGLEEPSWNFTKYLVNRHGQVVARFAPRAKPDDAELRQAIGAELGR